MKLGWFVLQTLTGQEQKVQRLIDAKSKEEGLAEEIGEVLMPTERVTSVKMGKKTTIVKKLFPGYLFIQAAVYQDDRKTRNEPVWSFIKGIQGVIGFLGGEPPREMPASEVEAIRGQATELQEKPKPKIIFEPGEMVAFGLVAPSREVAQVVGAVDVILVVAVAPDAEFGMGAAHGCGPFGRKSRDAQRLSRGAGVGFETGDEVREIALAQRLHVADVMAAVDVEADQQKTLLDAPCAAVGAFPAVHVGEGQIAVADARRAGEVFDGGLVFEPHGSEFHRIIRR